MTANLDISWLGEKQKTSMFIYGFQEYVSKNLLDRYFLGGGTKSPRKSVQITNGWNKPSGRVFANKLEPILGRFLTLCQGHWFFRRTKSTIINKNTTTCNSQNDSDDELALI